MVHFFKSDGFFEILLFLLAVLIHESGHLLAMLFLGEKPKGFRLGPGGAEIRFDVSFLPYRKEARVHLAGPLAGFLAALCTLWILRHSPLPSLFYFFFCNVFLSTLNLLPIVGLDGYNALFCYFCIHQDRSAARDALLPFHRAFSLILFLTGIALILWEQNPSLLLFQILLHEKRKSYDFLVA